MKNITKGKSLMLLVMNTIVGIIDIIVTLVGIYVAVHNHDENE